MSKKHRSATRRAGRRSSSGSPWLWIAGIGLIAVLGLGVWALSGGGGSTGGNGGLALEVDVNGAKSLRDAGAFVLDVRTQEEWQSGHVPGSTWIPLEQVESRFSEVPQGRDILVVCQSGNRSATAREMLLNKGYSRVTSLRGGLQVWQASGLPMVQGQ